MAVLIFALLGLVGHFVDDEAHRAYRCDISGHVESMDPGPEEARQLAVKRDESIGDSFLLDE